MKYILIALIAFLMPLQAAAVYDEELEDVPYVIPQHMKECRVIKHWNYKTDLVSWFTGTFKQFEYFFPGKRYLNRGLCSHSNTYSYQKYGPTRNVPLKDPVKYKAAIQEENVRVFKEVPEPTEEEKAIQLLESLGYTITN